VDNEERTENIRDDWSPVESRTDCLHSAGIQRYCYTIMYYYYYYYYYLNLRCLEENPNTWYLICKCLLIVHKSKSGFKGFYIFISARISFFFNIISENVFPYVAHMTIIFWSDWPVVYFLLVNSSYPLTTSMEQSLFSS
jgi:hypothetical protein